MKSLAIALVALMLTGFLGTQAKAQNNTVNGLIIGTAIGGIVGLIVGNEMDRNSYGRDGVYHQPVVYSPPPRPTRYYGNRDHSRHHYRSAQNRRDVVVVRDQHDRYRKSVETVYRERR